MYCLKNHLKNCLSAKGGINIKNCWKNSCCSENYRTYYNCPPNNSNTSLKIDIDIKNCINLKILSSIYYKISYKASTWKSLDSDNKYSL